jgi:Lrp/AsnC family leucine-responsive transcriptional regulator
MAPSAILERIRKLESKNLIQRHETRVDPEAAGLPLLAFVQVRVSDRIAEMTSGEQLAAIPNVQEVHHVAGEDCYLVKIRAADPRDLGELLREQIGALPSVLSTRTTIVLETVKESSRLPLLSSHPAPDREPNTDR